MFRLSLECRFFYLWCSGVGWTQTSLGRLLGDFPVSGFWAMWMAGGDVKNNMVSFLAWSVQSQASSDKCHEVSISSKFWNPRKCSENAPGRDCCISGVFFFGALGRFSQGSIVSCGGGSSRYFPGKFKVWTSPVCVAGWDSLNSLGGMSQEHHQAISSF